MVNPAPVRVPRKSTLSSPLVKAANKIVTSPTFAKARSIDFDKKNEYDKFIKFIESSNKELLRIKLPKKKDISKDGSGDGKGGGGGGLLNDLLRLYVGNRILKFFRKFKPFTRLRRFLIPKKIRARLRLFRMNFKKRLSNIKKFFLELPGKIRSWVVRSFNETMDFVKKKYDDAIKAIKNLPNAKWFQKIVRGSKNLLTRVDEGFKAAKETLMNSKVVKGAVNIADSLGTTLFGKTGKLLGRKLGKVLLAELSFGVIDVATAIYRFKQGDTTGGIISLLAAIPGYGLIAEVPDILRDFGMFEEGAALDKLDFMNYLRLNKDNPNYVDKRTDKEKEIDSEVDERLMDIYKKDLEKQLKVLEDDISAGRSIKGMNYFKLEKELKGLDKLTSTQLRNKVKKSGLLTQPLPKSYKNENFYGDMEKFLENLKTEVNPENENEIFYKIPEGGVGDLIPVTGSTTFINNSQTFLVPFDSGAQENSNGGFSGGFNLNVTPSIIVMNPNSLMMDELLQLKLDKE